MSKGKDSKKSDKKAPAKSMKEKKADKTSKKIDKGNEGKFKLTMKKD